MSDTYGLDEEGHMNVLFHEGVVYPHCDFRVLHAPGTCEYCDEHPDWQEERARKGIAYTNEECPTHHSLHHPCPSFLYRDKETIEKWFGNRAHPKQHDALVFPNHPVIPTKVAIFHDELPLWKRLWRSVFP